MSYERRSISLGFQLAEGSFDGGSDTVDVTGVRTSVQVTGAGGGAMPQASVRVYGLTLDVMNKISTLGKPLTYARNNRVSVSANGALVYVGNIQEAWIEAQGSPDVCLELTSIAGNVEALKPVPPSSWRGPVDVATVMASLAAVMDLNLENNGVQVTLPDSYFPGTAKMQVEACARAADINWTIDGRKLAIWPKNGARGDLIPVISKETGMVGYPAHAQGAITLVTLFNPQIVLFGRIDVKSDLLPAQGDWTVSRLDHELESETPDGAWFTHIVAFDAKLGGAPLA